MLNLNVTNTYLIPVVSDIMYFYLTQKLTIYCIISASFSSISASLVRGLKTFHSLCQKMFSLKFRNANAITFSKFNFKTMRRLVATKIQAERRLTGQQEFLQKQ